MNIENHIINTYIYIYMCVCVCVYSYENGASNIEQVQEATPHKAAAVRPPTTHHENYPH